MMVGGSRQETLDPGFVLLGTRQQGVPVILRELVLPDGFDLVSPSFTVRDVATELSGPRLTSCRTEMYLQLIDHWVVVMIKCHINNDKISGNLFEKKKKEILMLVSNLSINM
ncbi:unnamed protein product [Schistosoma margrebowiei]|uniref:Uncharacterized protein n=1 Tax=Schistosoma margrebowiei TaxID=48269 RepID=A0A183MYP7_9TREM|nr:unnamed protein product [Schistosoma margrebowiei]